MKFFFLSFFMIIFTACSQTEQTVPIKDRFDAIERIVGTANWKLVEGQDTSYLYFSRLGNGLFNVYHFKFDKGDTVNSKINTIVGRQDTINWEWQDSKLFLKNVTDSSIIWEAASDAKHIYELKKIDSIQISFIFPDGHKAAMKRTLPLATFLVRSHYDFLHGTHTVDSAIVPPRHQLKK